MDGKRVWITGASSGIGRETARQMAALGCSVAVTARSKGALKALREECVGFSGEVHVHPCDVTKQDEMMKCITEIEDNMGAIDIAILNAGTYKADNFDTFNAKDFKHQYDINVMGVAHALESLTKLFKTRKAGHIAIVSSVAGYRGLPKSIGYGSTKAALINLAEGLYIEAKPYNVKVQVICPGFVKTPLTDKNDFEMPMLMEVETAAAALIKGLQGSAFEITFPRAFSLILKTIGLLPDKAYLWLVGKATADKS